MRPPAEVLDAFGGSEPLVRLGGGRGTAWRAGGVALKRADVGLSELEWLHAARGRIATHHGIRVGLPVASRSGALIVDGWTASPYLPGDHVPGRWLDIAEVAVEFASSFAGLDRPPFLDGRDHAWARADRFAWGERDEPQLHGVRPIDQLLRARRPTRGVPGIIHGDLTPNVLFCADLPPAVIDPTVYWRPVTYSIAIVAVDAVCFEGAPLSLLDEISAEPEFPQQAIRALIFRIATDRLNGREETAAYDEALARVLESAAPRAEGSQI
jgi:uncharacterized protein (TIGR02569 family)